MNSMDDYYDAELITQLQYKAIVVDAYRAGKEVGKAERDRLPIMTNRPTAYIMDSIQTYVKEYWETGNAEHLTFKNEYMVIRDSFENFCRRSGIAEKLRKEVKEVLFSGSLAQIDLIVSHPEDKQKTVILTRPFIVVDGSREAYNEDLFHIERHKVMDFEISVYASLYNVLMKRKEI